MTQEACGQDEPAGALFAAVDFIDAMNEQPTAVPMDHLAAAVGEDGLITPDDLHRGFATLIYSLMNIKLLDDPLDLVPPIIRRLRRMSVVPERMLPTIAGVLTASALRQSPNRWRDQYAQPEQDPTPK